MKLKLYFLIIFLISKNFLAHEHSRISDSKIKKEAEINKNHMNMFAEKKLDSVEHTKNHEEHLKKNHKKMMHGMFGDYSATRESSGTSWVPDSTPMEGFHIMTKNWMCMFHGFSYFITDVQGGKLGDEKIFDENMFSFMAQRNFCKSILGFRTMFSFEPFTIGKCGYPLLLQTGETCDGKTPLLNRQHPHDLFMELAIAYSYKLKKDTSTFLYFGLPGEPALGPPVFLMRFSGEYIPEAPLGHHWMDSTHIVFGVLTSGFIYKNLKLEVSTFKGREPDQYRYDIEKPKFDSYSTRLTFNPTKNISLHASYGFLKSPEQLHPKIDKNRYTVGLIYNKNYDDSNFACSAILGVNENKPGNTLPAFLIEATYEYCKKHLFFTRFEIQKNDELFEEPDPFAGKIFRVEKLTLGYVYEFLSANHLKWGIGGLIDFPIVPDKIEPRYGNTFSYMFFLQFRLI